jgi:uncharacterized protein YegJ (DUF2314 family)
MKPFLIAALCILAVGARVRAAEEESRDTAGREAASGHPGYGQVSDGDKQMDQAVDRAQKSLGFFMAALRVKKDGDSVFEIKKAFVDGDKVEHIWIREVTFDGKNFHGKVDNRPVDVNNVHMGERVMVAPVEVSDWMFLKDGKLIGGYTTRVLYARLSPEEKAAFDKQADYKIE